ncbi:cation:dicarboxylate symporter family transporter, partial [Staphylococcus aureus]
YVALLQMIVMPLIFISIVAAFTQIQIGAKFATIGSLIFIFLIGTVTIAAIVGVVYALVFGLYASTINLGNAAQARGSVIAKQAKALTAHTFPQ